MDALESRSGRKSGLLDRLRKALRCGKPEKAESAYPRREPRAAGPPPAWAACPPLPAWQERRLNRLPRLLPSCQAGQETVTLPYALPWGSTRSSNMAMVWRYRRRGITLSLTEAKHGSAGRNIGVICRAAAGVIRRFGSAECGSVRRRTRFESPARPPRPLPARGLC